jgi:hypothetical protein
LRKNTKRRMGRMGRVKIGKRLGEMGMSFIRGMGTDK